MKTLKDIRFHQNRIWASFRAGSGRDEVDEAAVTKTFVNDRIVHYQGNCGNMSQASSVNT